MEDTKRCKYVKNNVEDVKLQDVKKNVDGRCKKCGICQEECLRWKVEDVKMV